MPYAQIAELLRREYNLTIQRPDIFKFIKVRSRGRKVYGYSRAVPTAPTATVPAGPRLGAPVPGPPAATTPTTERRSTRGEFRFTPSARYNLTRLPPEEAAAIRKKLEAEGH